MSNDNSDGIGGTDNVLPLFNNRPSAAGLPPQTQVVEELEQILQDAVTGKIAGIAIISFDAQGNSLPQTVGKIVYSSLITELETMKIWAIMSQQPFLTQGPKK